PDGTQIAFAAASEGQDSLKTWLIPAPLGGVAHPFVEGRGVRWSRDGRHITYIRAGGSAGDTLFVADADGSNVREILPANGGMPVRLTSGVGEFAEVRISADGRAMVCTLLDVRQSIGRTPVSADPPARVTPLSDGYTADLDPNAARAGDRIVFSSSRSGDRNI